MLSISTSQFQQSAFANQVAFAAVRDREHVKLTYRTEEGLQATTFAEARHRFRGVSETEQQQFTGIRAQPDERAARVLSVVSPSSEGMCVSVGFGSV